MHHIRRPVAQCGVRAAQDVHLDVQHSPKSAGAVPAAQVRASLSLGSWRRSPVAIVGDVALDTQRRPVQLAAQRLE